MAALFTHYHLEVHFSGAEVQQAPRNPSPRTELLLDLHLCPPSRRSAQLALKNLLMELLLQTICWSGSVPASFRCICPLVFPQHHCCQGHNWAFIVAVIRAIKAAEDAELEPGQAVSPTFILRLFSSACCMC